MNYQDIEQWLYVFGIQNYTIHDNLVVDVDDNVAIPNKSLMELPFQFGIVTGHFYCYNNKLISLKHSPTTVRGNFYCFNNGLRSLQFGPTTVGGSYICSNNKLTSLLGSSHTIGGSFSCSNNMIISLEYGPTTVGGWFECFDNDIESVRHLPDCVGSVNCYNNPLVVTDENEKDFVDAIKKYKDIYRHIRIPSKMVTELHKMLWEV